jgi:hypothetical protein
MSERVDDFERELRAQLRIEPADGFEAASAGAWGRPAPRASRGAW